MSAEVFATFKTSPAPTLLAPDERELADLIAEVYAAQTAGDGAFRPARDAAEMRALSRRAPQGLPAGTLARVWRTVAGDAWFSGPKRAIAQVCVVGGDAVEMMEAARGYFGFNAPLTPMMEIRETLERVLTTPGVLACLPWPEQAGPGQWWPMLNEQKLRGLSIVAAWPNLPKQEDAPRLAVVTQAPLEPSGDDEMLAMAHDDRWQAVEMLATAGLKAEVTARARSLALIRLAEFVTSDDPRLEVARRLGLDGLRLVGVRPRA